MADTAETSMDEASDTQDFADESAAMIPPPRASYPNQEALVAALKNHAIRHGYKIVKKTSSIPNALKPGRTPKIWWQCHRGGTYRPRNGLTEETRKRRRISNLIGCPFLIIAMCEGESWTFVVENAQHNHGPVPDLPRVMPLSKTKQGQLDAVPYDWPHDASFNKFTTALVIIDMQRDFCAPGGYLEYQGYDISATQALIPKLKNLLEAFRSAGFPIYHTREGHRPDLSTLSSREMFRSHNNSTGFGIGSEGPLGRLLIRGELGHDIVDELRPLANEPIIDKPGRGAFAHTDFDLLLRNKGIKNLVIAGVTTDVCVSSTMREANDRAYDCLLVEDASTASEENLHAMTCESVKMEGGIFGVTGKLENVIQALQISTIPKRRSSSKSKSPPRTTQPIHSRTSSSPVLPAAMMGRGMSTPMSTGSSSALGMSMSAGSMGAPFMNGATAMNGAFLDLGNS